MRNINPHPSEGKFQKTTDLENQVYPQACHQNVFRVEQQIIPTVFKKGYQIA